MAGTTTAATLVGTRQFEFREYQLPEIAPDDGLLKVEAVGICGSDVGTYRREVAKPRIMGHENVGVIAEIGKLAAERWGVQEGDLVIPEEYVPCLRCKYCLTGRFRFCNQTDRGHGQIYRHGQTTDDVPPYIWGGFSHYMYLPPNTIMHKIKNPVPPEVLALYLPLADGIEWAYRYGGAQSGKTVLIQGPGQMGISSAFAAKQAGADCVIVTGLSHDAARLELAKKVGADFTIDVQSEDFKERVDEITGKEGVDVVVNVTGGGPHVIADALSVASKQCTLVLAAAGNEQVALGIAGKQPMRRDLTVKTANGHSYDSVNEAIFYLTSGKHDELLEMGTHTFPLDQVLDALDTAGGEREPGAIHVTLTP